MQLFKNKKVLLLLIVLALITYYAINKSKANVEIIRQEEQNYVGTKEESIEQTNENWVEESYITIHISGQVIEEGIVEIKEGERIADAIEKAGGLTQLANLEQVNLAYKLEDGMKVYIPKIGEETEEKNSGIQGESSNESKEESLININKASQTELETLPGVGPSTAEKIIKYREENGDFEVVEDVLNVSGIGESKYTSMQEYICVK